MRTFTATHAAVALASVLAMPAQAALTHVESSVSVAMHNNCAFNQLEQMASGWASTSHDPVTQSPKVGELFYVSATFMVTGNICGGAGYVVPEFVLPQGVSFYSDENAPVYCEQMQPNGAVGYYDVDVCPQQPTAVGSHGGLVFGSLASTSGAWTVPAMGGALTVYIPVWSDAKLGAASLGAAKSVNVFQQYAGSTTGTFASAVPLTVFRNPPTVVPPEPATQVTHDSAHVEVVIENHFNAGQAFIEVGTNAFNMTNLFTLGPVEIPAANWSSAITADFENLPSDSDIFWRVKFVEPGRAPFYSGGAGFHTLPPPRFEIITTSTAGGSIVRSLEAVDYAMGTTVTLVAAPAEGFRFVQLIVDGGDVSASMTSVVMDRDHAVHAIFEELPAPAPPASSSDDEASETESGSDAPVSGDDDEDAPAGNDDDGSVGNGNDDADTDAPASGDNGSIGGDTLETAPPGFERDGDDDDSAGDEEAAGCSSTRASDAAPFIGLALVALLRARRRR